ncbi:GntR family transcriptional regulator [Palleronia aestuarii]|uniref:GntR family transcriptional regulator n=1 Tax=Palleronia aestuarii TaxID=568105 RepID=A0A2W7NCA0_9RHOB|nr:FCD domain-containing protein [Palleronia aestuarii]PZX14354.1 GntR family transcriptional regulator [Palleronia aestuarii]
MGYVNGGSSGKQRDVLEAIAEMIVSRGIGVDDRLPPELELARELGVGRSTVREAMKAWQGMAIVTRNKGAGTVLRVPIVPSAERLPLSISLEAQSLIRTLEVRRPLEIEAARHAAVRADERARHRIMDRMYTLLDHHAAGTDWRPADRRFHAEIHAATGNPLFAQMVEQLQRAFHDVYGDPIGEPQLGAASIPLHRPLAEAIRDGAPDRAAAVMGEIVDMVETATHDRMGDLNHD